MSVSTGAPVLPPVSGPVKSLTYLPYWGLFFVCRDTESQCNICISFLASTSTPWVLGGYHIPFTFSPQSTVSPLSDTMPSWLSEQINEWVSGWKIYYWAPVRKTEVGDCTFVVQTASCRGFFRISSPNWSKGTEAEWFSFSSLYSYLPLQGRELLLGRKDACLRLFSHHAQKNAKWIWFNGQVSSPITHCWSQGRSDKESPFSKI